MLAYDALNIMLESIKRAGTTNPEAIKEQLKTGSFNAVSGTIRFNENRNPIKQGVIITIQNGKQRLYTKVLP